MKRIFALLMMAAALLGAATYPENSMKDKLDPNASPQAVVGGTIVEHLGPSPKSLNYYLDANSMSARVFGSLYESLITINSANLEYDRCIAEKWTISDDRMTFTFWIDPNARWSDGHPITAEDVVWTYQAIVDPKNMTGPHKLSLERVHPPEIVDGGRAVRFVAKEVHWNNLGAVGDFPILPKHVFGKMDFNKINFEFPVVSGPCRIREFKEGVSLTLERRPDWWRIGWPSVKGSSNFERTVCRFYSDRDNSFDAFLKGEIDMYPVYTASQWHQVEKKYKAVRNNWIVRKAVYNQAPIGFQGFAMNMRRSPFDDVRVRKAMAHLLDRRTMNRTLMYGQYFLHRSYMEDLYDAEHPCPNVLVEYDPEAARRLLAEAGWRANPKSGILEKNGRPFEFTFLSRDGTSDKFLSIFQQALKDVGIRMNIQNKDWSAWAKDMDCFNFDMTWAAWGAGLYKNPEPMWSSGEADREGGSNLCGFRNAEVDALIEKQKGIFNVAERHEICRKIDHIVFEQHPYVLLWNSNHTRLLYWNKFGTPEKVLGKYSREDTTYWWYDEDLAAELQEAMRENLPLPQQSPVVRW